MSTPPDSSARAGFAAVIIALSTNSNTMASRVQAFPESSSPISSDTAPSARAGDSHTTIAELITSASNGDAPPKPHGLFVSEKCAPETRTTVPPSVIPTVGITLATRAGVSYSNSTAPRVARPNTAPSDPSTPTDTVVNPPPCDAGASHRTMVGATGRDRIPSSTSLDDMPPGMGRVNVSYAVNVASNPR